MLKKIFYLLRKHCEFKNCSCDKYQAQDHNKRNKINPICKKCQHGKCWHFLQKDLPS